MWRLIMRNPVPISRRHPIVGALLVISALAALVAWSPFASADAVEDLRDGIPSGDVVREEVATLSNERDGVLGELNAAEGELRETLEARDRFDDDQRRLAAQIEVATDHLKRVAVQTFVSGGSTGDLEFLLSVSEVSELSWRRHLLHNHAQSSDVAVRRLQTLEAQASDEVRGSIEAAAELREQIDALSAVVADLEAQIADARELEPLADAWDRAAIAIEEGRYGLAPEEKWEQLRFCESTNNYSAVNPSGKYRGAYQFDLETWQTVGGTGDPAAAPPAEQDARARELYARRGHEPWPECGFYLQ